MEIPDNNLIFTNSFEIYKHKFDQLKELYEDVLPKSLRLFDIRFRLALSLQIGFDHAISYTKTETTRETYTLIFKLNDLWFAYEGLYKLCSENSYLKSNSTKSTPFTVQTVSELLLDEQVTNFGTYLNDNIYTDTRLKADLINYLEYLVHNSFGNTQLGLLNSFKSKTTDNEKPSFNEILAFIYAIRNMYVHSADTARSGVSRYKTKILALKNCTDFLTLISVIITTKIIEEKIAHAE